MNTTTTIPNETPFRNGAPTVESVRQWRETIDSYFSEDWEHLRNMIMQLEESLWTDDELEHQREEAALSKAIPTELMQKIAGSEAAKVQEEPTPEIESARDEGQSQDRLSDLARRIEARLQNQQAKESGPKQP
ncbi:hypothetical protein KOR42_14920 [Thalassoglobus neptunius]|uniref:Uncharacterized protein n=1 Tax=Thalassoglobus neptunius TaxID=1938619 RepID=A0A5C5X6Z8_9PLAN|nr:hypothetical protein [Thalassoglobus neptunius]TWT58121.1 hypothetical protein KOR42_14920 [Thalassoglobus neptunius]